MAFADFAQSTRGGLGALANSAMQMIVQRLERRRAYLRTLSELAALSDSDLADIGLHRSEIARVAKESVSGPRG